jgi:hypothetical protein
MIHEHFLLKYQNWNVDGEYLGPAFCEDCDQGVTIMATSYQIHDYATKVLYGKNIFAHNIRSHKRYNLFESSVYRLPMHYIRFIKKFDRDVTPTGDDNDPSTAAIHAGYATTLENMKQAVECLKNNQPLKTRARFWNSYTSGP